MTNKDFESLVLDTFKGHEIHTHPQVIKINLKWLDDSIQSDIVFTSYHKHRYYTIHSCGIKFTNTEIRPNYEKETLQLIKDSVIPNIYSFYKHFKEINMLQAVDIVSYIRNIKLNQIMNDDDKS